MTRRFRLALMAAIGWHLGTRYLANNCDLQPSGTPRWFPLLLC